jgi:hypothetical protein
LIFQKNEFKKHSPKNMLNFDISKTKPKDHIVFILIIGKNEKTI